MSLLELNKKQAIALSGCILLSLGLFFLPSIIYPNGTTQTLLEYTKENGKVLLDNGTWNDVKSTETRDRFIIIIFLLLGSILAVFKKWYKLLLGNSIFMIIILSKNFSRVQEIYYNNHLIHPFGKNALFLGAILICISFFVNEKKIKHSVK